MKMLYLRGCLLLALSLGVVGFSQAEIAVIVNPDSGISKLSTSQVKRLFLGKSRRLPNGQRALPVNQEEGSPVREEFNSKVLRKNERQIKAYWSKKIFSGKAQAPKELGNDAAVKAFVAENPNAIGFIDARHVDDRVRVVLRVR